MLIPVTKASYDRHYQTFTIGGKSVIFDTMHTIINPKTNGSMKFELSHSTGSEWDPKTIWVYKSVDTDITYLLHVTNEDVTPAHAEAYLQAKLRNA